MLSTDQLEVLLRTIPQYFLFAALVLYIFGWMNKKPNLGLIAEIVLVVIGLLSALVMLSGMIPSPSNPDIVEEHVKMVIKMLTLFVINGGLAGLSLCWRFFKKKPWDPIVVAIFAVALVIFFQSAKLSKTKFDFNPVKTEITTDSLK